MREFSFLKNLNLADPASYKVSAIDYLLGGHVYSLILKNGLRKSSDHTLAAQNTKLGWIIIGSVP